MVGRDVPEHCLILVDCSRSMMQTVGSKEALIDLLTNLLTNIDPFCRCSYCLYHHNIIELLYSCEEALGKLRELNFFGPSNILKGLYECISKAANTTITEKYTVTIITDAQAASWLQHHRGQVDNLLRDIHNKLAELQNLHINHIKIMILANAYENYDGSPLIELLYTLSRLSRLVINVGMDIDKTLWEIRQKRRSRVCREDNNHACIEVEVLSLSGH